MEEAAGEVCEGFACGVGVDVVGFDGCWGGWRWMVVEEFVVGVGGWQWGFGGGVGGGIKGDTWFGGACGGL